MSADGLEPDGYPEVLAAVLAEIHRAEVEHVRRSNALVVDLYARVGHVIVGRQRDEVYGSQLVERLARDLAGRFAGQRGWQRRWSRRNLSWTHHQVLLDGLNDTVERSWYLDQAITNNWSSRVLIAQVRSGLHKRIGMAPSNFERTVPELAGDALDQLATDPYRLDFMQLDPAANEHAMEQALVERITDFLTHLGRGFAYLGRQWKLTVGDTDFFLDLAFYNVHLHAYAIFELKSTAFAPAHAGQLAFYVTAIERQVRRLGDYPTIGILLVPGKDNVVVEYALASTSVPMTVASYTHHQLPADIRAELPAADELALLLDSSAPS